MKDNNKTQSSRGPGQPTKYKPEFNKIAYDLTLLGYTDKQLAEYFEVNEDTIYEWKKAHRSFSEALKKGKSLVDARVAGSLLKRALGFKYDEVTFEKVDSKEVIEQTPEGTIKVDAFKKKVVTKLVIPDVGAQMNWLKNRQKELWRENEIDFSKFTEEQLDYIIEGLRKKTA
jgi:hypothetical protein